MKYIVSGQVTETIEVIGDTIAEAEEKWRKRAGGGYPDGWEEAIDDGGDPDTQQHGEIFGGCEVCGGPIIEGEPYEWDEDGIQWHKDCPTDSEEPAQ